MCSYIGPGVYLVANVRTGKVYIGSSINVSARLAQHFAELSRGNHPNRHLQSSWNKWGKEFFTGFLIMPFNTIEEARDEEQWYLNVWPVEDMYNLNLNVFGPPSGVSVRKNPNRSKSMTPQKREYLKQVAKDKERCRMEERKRLGLFGKKPTLMEGRKPYEWKSVDTRQRRVSRASRNFSPLIDPEGNIHRGENLREFCRQKGLRLKSIEKLLQGLQHTTAGWRLLYPVEMKPDRNKKRNERLRGSQSIF